MLNAIIRFSLRQRLLVVAFSLFLLGYGGWQALHMDIDVFPNLNRPRVVVMTEAPGMAPEEVEALITFPLETALNGANGVVAVRTSSGVGISIIYVEFDWGTDIYDDRQIVMERMQLAQERLPEGIQPTLAPISSIMGQIVMMGMWSQENDRTLIAELPPRIQIGLEAGQVPEVLRDAIGQHAGDLSSKATVETDGNTVRWIVMHARDHPEFIDQRYPVHRTRKQLTVEYRDKDQGAQYVDLDGGLSEVLDRGDVPPELLDALRQQGVDIEPSAELVVEPQTVRWFIRDEQFDRLFVVRKNKNTSQFELHQLTSDLRLRTVADWVVRQRLLTIPGVSQVFTMGGGRKQFQVLVDPDALLRYGITLHDVKRACIQSNENATGGYLDEQGPHELLVRSLGRVQDVEDLQQVVVTIRNGRPVTLQQVARVVEGPQVKRGDSSAFRRNKDGTFSGGPAVVLTINKQPGADTRGVTDEIVKALAEIRPSLPPDVHIEAELYSQKAFIDRAIENVAEALRDGGVLVVIILFLFLMNLRTTFITLTAIPLSIAITAVVFTALGLSINTMTLGGLAIAIGELVDDAIVDVENIFRRLKENRRRGNPKHPLLVVFQASVEIRNSIVFGTIIVVLVFVPLFALSGMEGRLFTPLGIAYIVSILSSLLVSLTLTPVLSYWLLGKARLREREKDGPLLRSLKWVAGGVISTSIRLAKPVLLIACVAVAAALVLLINRERGFLPPFNEGSVQLNVILPPGTSLLTSNEIGRTVEGRLRRLEDVLGFVRRTGRAELDEHAEGVSFSELIIDLDPDSPRSREEQLEQIRKAVEDIPGIQISVEQPLAHLISHMLSGIKAQVGIKIYGDDLDTLRQKAEELKAAMADVEGVEDLLVEPQVVIPQLRIELNRDRLESYGLTPAYVNDYINTAMNGQVVSEVLIGQRTFDLLVRMDEKYREDRQVLKRLSIDLPGGGTTPLSSLAKIYESGGPNTINREQVRRRIVIQCNVSGRGLVDVVQDIQARHQPIIAAWKEPGYFVEYGGQFESQQAASRVIGVLFCVSLLAIFLVLYTMFGSANFSLQVMAALPMAFIGSVAALVLTDQKLTIASMVGFISLGGIASRNGILLINHYLHLVRYEGESWTKEMIVRAGKERLAPVLMTALTSGIALVPLALAAGEPGKEILYPVATVIIGGLLSSTILEFFVRPALFWTFGRKVGERLIAETRAEVPLMEESEMHRAQQVADQ